MSAVSTGSKFHKSWCASSRFSLHCFLDFPLAFLLSSWWFFLGGGWRKPWGESRNLSRVTRRITSVKHHLKGGVQKIIRAAPAPPPPHPLQAINNDWSLTEAVPRSMIMINKSLPQEPIRPHFLWVYQRNNLRGILGEHHLQAFLISCSPNIPNKIKWVLSPVHQ